MHQRISMKQEAIKYCMVIIFKGQENLIIVDQYICGLIVHYVTPGTYKLHMNLEY